MLLQDLKCCTALGNCATVWPTEKLVARVLGDDVMMMITIRQCAITVREGTHQQAH